MIYKKGEKVRIKKLEEVKHRKHGDSNSIYWAEGMNHFAGTVQEISSAYDGYYMKGDEELWIFTDSMIEGLAEEGKPISEALQALRIHTAKILASGPEGCRKYIASLELEFDEPVPPKDEGKDVPPGIFEMVKDGHHVIGFKDDKDYNRKVKEWLDDGFVPRTIRDENDFEWTVGEKVHSNIYGNDLIIKEFKWNDVWYVHYGDCESIPAQNCMKLPPQQQPEPVDRERLERFVLAAMGTNAIHTHDQLIEYAAVMMKAVDDYKPVTN